MRVVYTSSSLALAVLEILAYRHARRPLAPRHLFEVDLEDARITRLAPADLPDEWSDYPHPESTQRLGDAWVEAGATLALAVPSVLAPPETNVVLNCVHPAFSSLEIDGPREFPINPRLAPDADA